MKKLFSVLIAFILMATLSISALATSKTDDVVASGNKVANGTADSIGISTATSTDGNAWLHGIDDDAVNTATDSTTDINVWGTTTQTDKYKVTIAWGDMTFNYNFGTWNTETHLWDGGLWNDLDFDGIKNKVTVTNHSSQSIGADFSYSANVMYGGTTSATFQNENSGGNGMNTGTMNLIACSVGQVDAPSASTFLNLQGIPAYIGSNATKIGTITVTVATH